ncbi:glutathione S-transferase family protein [Gymnodinialimonas ulvae]|uniref:glutathione S-transferase family protein n=1 Tax=Gymnodinialimonas ulvae TaxID=3126504 RepID=UPI0030B552BB
MTYQVYGSVRSRAMRVLWTLEELGVDYDFIEAAPRSPEAKAVNPTGKVPFMVADGQMIPDSVAIMTFLADKHGQLTAPAGTLARATQDAFTHQVNDEIDGILWAAARHSFILPEEHRVAALKDSLKWEFARNQDAVAARMNPDGPFVAGDHITIADILLSHCMGWAANAKFDVTNPRLIAHNDMMRARPAFERALKQGA